jgi:hypothetical protein
MFILTKLQYLYKIYDAYLIDKFSIFIEEIKMLTINDVDSALKDKIQSIFGEDNFFEIKNRKWLKKCSTNIYYIFEIKPLKGNTYSPAWGISIGDFLIYKNKKLYNQSTEKQKDMNLIIDPIDESGEVPDYNYCFFPTLNNKIPYKDINNCVLRSFELSKKDFEKVKNFDEFKVLVNYRKGLTYNRFGFFNYINHILTDGLLAYIENNDESKINDFCKNYEIDYEDKKIQKFMIKYKKMA